MKQSLLFGFALCACLTIVSCQTPSDKVSGIELLPPTSFMEAFQAAPEGLLIDCRTPGEVARGSVEGALNIDYRSPTFTEEVEKLDKTKPIYIYCQVGGRSASAARKLHALGFEEVYDMKGGYSAFSKK